MVVKRQRAEALGLRSIGDLRRHPQLEIVVSHEFLEREDGWPGLTRAYGIQHEVVGIEHALAYQAIEEGAVDVTDGYSTDGEIERYDLIALEDDLGFFPKYLAAPLVREGLGSEVIQILGGLGDTLDDAQMQAMTSAVVFDKLSFAEVAQGFLAERGVVTEIPQNPLLQSLATNTLRHLQLTFIALASAIVVGVGLSLVIFRSNHTSKAVIYFCGLLQTIPSIALLALMIPVFGIGFTPAILALFLYSLLPILRNSVTALTTIDPTLLRVAVAMGLSNHEQLRYVYVPLSMPSMLAGIRTAAVISIGTATLAAFIGAGGLGEPIVTGLALNDVSLILQGAIPAAMLAIVTELLFEIVERFTVPGHLRD
jgi:osmoprotectant transport system permease protein